MNACQARTLLHYEPETGLLYWHGLTGARANRNGMIAGTPMKCGYIKVQVGGVAYLAHRLAWLIHYGRWPARDLDHRDRVRVNNRIKNLRLATPTQNSQNKSDQPGRSGISGVVACGKRWYAHIGHGGRRHHLGMFDSIQSAQAARDAAKREFKWRDAQ